MNWCRVGPAREGNRWHVIVSRDANVTLLGCSDIPVPTRGTEVRTGRIGLGRCEKCWTLESRKATRPTVKADWERRMAARRLAEHITPHDYERKRKT
jgi:hypothetical protein